MVVRRCSGCGRALGIGFQVRGTDAGVCELCTVRLEAEGALSHALVAVAAIQQELERARTAIWPPPPTQEGA